MTYLPPFAVLGTHRLDTPTLKHFSNQYLQLLNTLASGDFDAQEMCRHEFLNDWMGTRPPLHNQPSTLKTIARP